MWILDELEKRSDLNQPALIHREKSFSFSELWDRSECLASYIQQACCTNAPVVIYGNKDMDITTVMLACLKTGRAYVPVDITFPEDRLLTITEMVESELLFDFSGILPQGNFTCISQKQIDEIVLKNSLPPVDKSCWVGQDDNCYILFTSGSTGVPKGVQIRRRNIENFTSWFAPYCSIPDDRHVVLNQVSYSFDVSVISLYLYLPMGLTLFHIDKGMIEQTKLLFDYLANSEVAVWISTPAFLEICSFDDTFDASMMPSLCKFILAGEVLTKKLVRTLQQKFPGASIVNGYGPTEGTVLLSACEITDEMLENEKSLPIGSVLSDGDYSIVGENGQPVPQGEPGELVVVSRSISEGYFKNPEQTDKVFFTHSDGRRGYRTGDLCFEQDGMVYYIARKDFQIKLNGYRIELDDISSNLNKIDYVSNNVVLPVYKDERVSYIVAFVTLKKNRPALSDIKTGIQIKNELKQYIPSYMIPRKVVILDRFPLNPNGKIDRKKLREDHL